MVIWAQEYISTLYPETIFCPIPHTEHSPICQALYVCFLGQIVLFTLDKVSISLYYLKFSLSNKSEAEDFKPFSHVLIWQTMSLYMYVLLNINFSNQN